MKDKRLKTVHLFENEVDLIVGDGEEKRLAGLPGIVCKLKAHPLNSQWLYHLE